MSPQIADEIFIGIGWRAFATIGNIMPPRDPDEEGEDEDEDEDDQEDDSDDEPAVVREPDEE
jgi:hypothetical protein